MISYIRIFLGWILLLSSLPALGQDYVSTLPLRMRIGEEKRAQSGDVQFAALDPVVQRSYLPRIVPCRSRWKQWETTNYARNLYRRYLGFGAEQRYIYDVFGNPIRGWTVFEWSQTQPKQFGSGLFKSGGYAGWFSKLTIAQDTKGGRTYTLTIGDQIRTTLTPMTFSKPAFNGVQWDIISDRYATTILMSRLNSPILGYNLKGIPDELTDNTNLLGGRVVRNVGDFVSVGATFVNAHQSQTLLGFHASDFLRGNLTTEQNKHIWTIQIRLSDDSPEDGVAGAWLFSQDILITGREGKTVRGKDIGFIPLVEGGVRHPGFLAADGHRSILLTYDFTSPIYNGPRVLDIVRVSFRLKLGGDYRVAITSDRQTNEENLPVFLPVARAPGNPQAGANLKVVEFDYGLPTANGIYGLTFDVVDWRGFHLSGEWNRNRRYFRYPNRTIERKHYTSIVEAGGEYLNVSYRRYPFLLFGEMFAIDDDYSTTAFVVNRSGRIDYEDVFLSLYEFVDDNDDHDRYPDWKRLAQGDGDYAVFPGYDENGDFISDFNQNDNAMRRNYLPDYEEPFLRYNVDRPEYLFGMDMDNNGTIDRLENDNLPDYPYKRGHSGYNLYVGAHAGPGIRGMVGQKRSRRSADGTQDRVTYGLFLLDRSSPRFGRLRIFEHLRKVKDSIPDHLLELIHAPPVSEAVKVGSWTYQRQLPVPTQREIEDLLYARNTWINTAFVGWEYRPSFDLCFEQKIKGEIVHQRDRQELLRERNARRDSGMFGMIHKLEYVWSGKGIRLTPRWKSELLLQCPHLKTQQIRRELRETVSCVLRTGFYGWRKARTYKRFTFEVGGEGVYFNQLREPVPEGMERDYWEVVGLVQLTHWTAYEGYRMATQIGFRMDRRAYRRGSVRVSGTSYVTVIAGIQQ